MLGFRPPDWAIAMDRAIAMPVPSNAGKVTSAPE